MAVRSRATRERLIAQVGGLCSYCRVRPADHLDHIVPRALGGSNALANLAPACTPCGQSKGDLTVLQWALVLAAEMIAARELRADRRPVWRRLGRLVLPGQRIERREP